VTDHTSVARFVGIVLDKNGQAAAIANVRVWIHDVPKGNWGLAGRSAKDPGC
jgi:phenylpyruvate tautomerase PptA (4-oxalocrotonate tautomerase family)